MEIIEIPELVDSHCHLDLIEKNGFFIDDILTKCKEKNVTILQNISTNFKNFALGSWLVKQRSAFKDQKLESWKIELLDSVGWVADPFGTA